jgi:hypothetical protein
MNVLSPIPVALTIGSIFILLMLHAKLVRWRETRSVPFKNIALLREIDIHRSPVPVDFFFYAMKRDDQTPPEVLMVGEEVEEKYLSGKNLLMGMFVLIFSLIISLYIGNFPTFRAHAMLILAIIPISFTFGFVLLYLTVKTGNEIALKYDDMLKSAANEIIMEIMKIFKKNGLSGKDFPIKLRHNDYRGLIYEEKGKNDYIAYVVME